MLPENEFEVGQESAHGYGDGYEGQTCSTMPASKISCLKVTDDDGTFARRASSLSKRFSSSLRNLSSALSPPSSPLLWSKIKANLTLTVKDEPSMFHRSSSLDDAKWHDNVLSGRTKKDDTDLKERKVSLLTSIILLLLCMYCLYYRYFRLSLWQKLSKFVPL